MHLKKRPFQLNIALCIILQALAIVSVCSLAFAAREHKPGSFVRPLDPGYPNNVVSPDGNTIVKYENISSTHNRVSFFDRETNELMYQYNYNPKDGHNDSRTHAYKAYFSPDSTTAVLDIIFYGPESAIVPFVNLKHRRIVYEFRFNEQGNYSLQHYFSPDGQISHSKVTKDYHPWSDYKLNFADMETGSLLWSNAGTTTSWSYSTPSITSDGRSINFVLNGANQNISTPTASLPDDPPSLPPLSIFSYEIDKSQFPTIRYIVAVTNSKGEGITGLSASNFSVTENGTSQNPLAVNAQAGGRPLSVAIALDTSGSISDSELQDINAAAKNFVNLLGGSDRAAIYKFSTGVHLIQNFTENKSTLNSAISGGRPSGNYTSLYDAIYDAINSVSTESNERKAVIALTDGKDNDSSHSKQQTIDFAVSKGVIVCTVGLGDFVDNQVLYDIAVQAGGQYHRSPSTAELQEIYARISGSLQYHYQISYRSSKPQKDGTSRTVTTTVSVGGDSARVSKSYTAPLGIKPTAYIDSISPNPTYRGKTVTFSGRGADLDGSITEYYWRSSIDGYLSNQQSFSTSTLSKGSHTIYLKVKDNDDFWSDETSAGLTVNNNPPQASIDSVSPSAPRWGETVTFRGSGSDIDGYITDYYWRSSIDGYLSNQSSFFTLRLSKGTHTIYFKVKDNDGDWSSEVSISLKVENNSPTAKIDSITPNPATYRLKVTFAGSGTDIDGTIAEYSWRSSIDGQLNDKNTFGKSDLKIGKHTIYFKVKDNDGAWSDEVSQDLEVRPGDTSPDNQHGKSRHGNPSFVGDPINSVNGNVHISVSGIHIPGKAGLALNLNFAYNSQKYYEGPLGFGWTHSYNVFIVETTSTAGILEEDGHVVYFNKNQDGTYSPAKGEYSTLRKNSDGGHLWRKKHGIEYNFSPQGKLLSIKEPNDNKIAFSYNQDGLLVGIVDTAGRRLTISYNADKRIAIITDPKERSISLSYDSQGNLIKIVDMAGGVIQYEYRDTQDPHNVTRSIDQNGHSVYWGYDSQDRCIISYRDNDEEKIQLSYLPDEKKTITTDANGNKTTRLYNQDGLVTKIIDALGNSIDYEWDADYNKTSITDQNGNTIRFQYDANSNLLKSIILMDPANASDDIITAYTYEPQYNKMTSLMDAEGNTTTYEYDSRGNLITIISPATFNYRTENTYDVYGQLVSIKDARGNIARYTYDQAGNLKTQIDALGGIITYNYDEVGNLIEMIDKEANSTKYAYDNLNRLVKITYADNTYITTGYDGTGNKIRVTNQLGDIMRYEYDAADRLTRTITPLGFETTHSYDKEGNLKTITDAHGNATSYEYDALNRLIKTKNAAFIETLHTYDPAGNLIKKIDGNKNVINYEYDRANRQTKITYSDGTSVTFKYDNLNRCTEMVDKTGRTAYTYNQLGRLISVTKSSPAETISYEYDEVGNRTKMIYSNGSIQKVTQYTYDELNRLTVVIDPSGNTTTYEYYKNGNTKKTSYPNQTQVTYEYDNLNRVILLKNIDSAGNVFSGFGYEYDLAGRRTKVTLSDGGVITYGYDNDNRLTSEIRSNTQNDYTISYEYDKVGNRTKMIKDQVITTYTYNNLNQLITRTQSNATGGNLITVCGTVEDTTVTEVTVNGIKATISGNRFKAEDVPIQEGDSKVTAIATDRAGNTSQQEIKITQDKTITTAYYYDKNGNMLYKSDQGRQTYYTYDFENRLTSVSLDAFLKKSFTYDGDGKRVSITSGSFLNSSYCSFDGFNLISDGSFFSSNFYTRGISLAGDIGSIISKRRRPPFWWSNVSFTYYHYDAQGNVIGYTNKDGSKSGGSFVYDSYGNLLSPTNFAGEGCLFSTKHYDSRTGLYYFGARYYDPSIGRFITPDPSGMIDGPNFYIYCNNNPINFIDPWGLCKQGKSSLFDYMTAEAIAASADEWILHLSKQPGLTGNVLRRIIPSNTTTGTLARKVGPLGLTLEVINVGQNIYETSSDVNLHIAEKTALNILHQAAGMATVQAGVMGGAFMGGIGKIVTGGNPAGAVGGSIAGSAIFGGLTAYATDRAIDEIKEYFYNN